MQKLVVLITKIISIVQCILWPTLLEGPVIVVVDFVAVRFKGLVESRDCRIRVAINSSNLLPESPKIIDIAMVEKEDWVVSCCL